MNRKTHQLLKRAVVALDAMCKDAEPSKVLKQLYAVVRKPEGGLAAVQKKLKTTKDPKELQGLEARRAWLKDELKSYQQQINRLGG
jgi:hypothetical protein